MGVILSILIPTIPERSKMFIPLWNELHQQLTYMETFHPTLGRIEILFNDDKRFLDGGPSIGEKCNKLLKLASGKYLCFLHDDDFIAPNYLETLVRLCQQDKDVVGFKNFTKMDNFWTIVEMSLTNVNHEANPNFVTRRTPWIICPVRSIFAKMFDFPDISYGEDAKWME